MVHLHWRVVLEVEIAFRPMPSFVVVQPGLDLSPFWQREKEYKCLLGFLTQINPSLLVNFQSRKLGHFAFWRDDHLLPGFAGREDLSQLVSSYVSVRSSRYEARGKFGQHERCVIRVARGVADFPRASYFDERTADVWSNCFITFSTRWKIFSLDVTSVHIGIWSTLAQLNLIRQIY